MNSSELKLQDIRPDTIYDFSFPHCPQRGADLEKKFPGLPLLIVDHERRLVWGHDRFRWLLGRGRKRAVVLQVTLDRASALFLNFNLSNRLFGLNLYEKLLFIRKISGLCLPAEIQRRAELDFSLNDALLRSLDALLDVRLRKALAGGHLCLKAALRLTGLSVSDQKALLGLLLKVRFSESHQLQIMQLLEEIAFREKRPLAGSLASLRLGAWLKREMPQRGIMDALNRRRFPAFMRRESDWRQWQKKKAAPGRVALSHAPFFASEEIQILLTAKNSVDAEKILKKLK